MLFLGVKKTSNSKIDKLNDNEVHLVESDREEAEENVDEVEYEVAGESEVEEETEHEARGKDKEESESEEVVEDEEKEYEVEGDYQFLTSRHGIYYSLSVNINVEKFHDGNPSEIPWNLSIKFPW